MGYWIEQNRTCYTQNCSNCGFEIDDKTKNEEYGTGSYAIDENTVKQL